MNKPASRSLPLLLPSVAALIVASVLYAYLYWQTSASVDRAVLARQVFQAEEETRSQSKDVQLEYQSTASSRARLGGLFVPASNAVVFIETLESIGPASGATVSISSIQADTMTGAAPGTIGSIVAGLQAEGTWAEVMKTLVLAESLPYHSVIDHVSLVASSGPAGRASAPSWDLSFQISSSILAGPAAPAQ